MKTLLAAFALSAAAFLNAAPMEKDAAPIVLTQSEIENATRWDEIRRWTTEASARGASITMQGIVTHRNAYVWDAKTVHKNPDGSAYPATHEGAWRATSPSSAARIT